MQKLRTHKPGRAGAHFHNPRVLFGAGNDLSAFPQVRFLFLTLPGDFYASCHWVTWNWALAVLQEAVLCGAGAALCSRGCHRWTSAATQLARRGWWGQHEASPSHTFFVLKRLNSQDFTSQEGMGIAGSSSDEEIDIELKSSVTLRKSSQKMPGGETVKTIWRLKNDRNPVFFFVIKYNFQSTFLGLFLSNSS